jgi:predicted DNA-binding transcriptional regulator AlpA
MPGTYLLPDEAASYLRVAVKTLTKWRGQGKGPPYRKVAGSLIRYVQEELEDWMQAQAVIPGVTLDDLPTPPTPRAAPGSVSRAGVHALPPRRRASRAPH